MKIEHSNFESFRLSGVGSIHSPVSKFMAWNLRTKTLVSALLFLNIPFPGFAESIDSKIQEGISQYHEGKYKEAGESFSSARNDRPEDSRIAYNHGNAQYKDSKFQEALNTFTQAAIDEKNPDIRKKSIYNTGNALVKLGKLKEAESAFKKTLTLDPSDMDAKFNLEYVRKQLKQKKEQKQQKRQNQDSGQDKQKEKEDSSSENKQGDPQQQTNDKGQKEESPPAPPENAKSEQKDAQPSEQTEESTTMKAEMSKEEAERMLNGLTEDLKSISRMQAGKTKSAYQGNDW